MLTTAMNSRLLLRHCLRELRKLRRLASDQRQELDCWQLASQGSHDSLWWYDCTTEQLYGSRRWWAGMGYRYDNRRVSWQLWRTWIHPDDVDLVMATYRRYLAAPPTTHLLQCRYRLRDLKGSYHWRADQALGQWDDQGRPRWLAGSSRDVQDQENLGDATQPIDHDPLTQLFNRHYFIRQMQQSLEEAQQQGELQGLFLIDIDRFQNLNESFGHSGGDHLLVQVAQRLQAVCVPGDILARLGGDEFALLSKNLLNHGVALEMAQRLQRIFTAPFHQDGRWISLSAGVGVALNRLGDEPAPRYQETTTWLRDADLALHQAKSQGRGEWLCFEPALQRRRAERMQVENELKQALNNGELRLFFQPIVELRTGRYRSVEALIRWQHPQRGLLTPGAFVPIAEEAGLLPALGDWVLVQACRELAALSRSGVALGDFIVAVNIAGPQFADPTIAQRIAELLAQWQVNPANLRLEITETLIANPADWVSEQLNSLRALGISVAIDDFGTGHSSLARLLDLPFDLLKLDAFFLRHLDQPRRRTLLEGLIHLAHRLNLPTVIEGIENPQQHLLVNHLGCDYGQGFLFCRPLANLHQLIVDSKTKRF